MTNVTYIDPMMSEPNFTISDRELGGRVLRDWEHTLSATEGIGLLETIGAGSVEMHGERTVYCITARGLNTWSIQSA